MGSVPERIVVPSGADTRLASTNLCNAEIFGFLRLPLVYPRPGLRGPRSRRSGPGRAAAGIRPRCPLEMAHDASGGLAQRHHAPDRRTLGHGDGRTREGDVDQPAGHRADVVADRDVDGRMAGNDACRRSSGRPSVCRFASHVSCEASLSRFRIVAPMARASPNSVCRTI